MLRAAIVAAVLTAVITVEISSRSGVMWRLFTFTYQANVWAAAHYLWTVVTPRANARVGLRGAVVLNICVLGGCVLAVGYALLAVNRLATPARIDAV